MLVNVRNLTKTLGGKPVLRDLNFSVPKGKITALVGPDGAGKTTLIRLIAGLLLPTRGTISLDGKDSVRDVKAIHQIIGYMPQRFGLYEDLTVQQNLNLYADLQGVDKSEIGAIFERLLSFTGLSAFTGRLAGNLSGGMKQKLGLACTLLRKPTLLLLDEPTVGVDPVSRRELWRMVQELLAEEITVLWSTAYLDEAEKAPFAILLNEGSVLFQGASRDLTKRVEGRTFLMQSDNGNRRALLASVLSRADVIDGMIQGNNVRIVTKEKSDSMQGGERVEPRFEDAFIDILGGGPKRESLLAQRAVETSSVNETPIEAKELTRQFGSFTAADKITFSVKRGEIFGFLGPNGAGKSTTFKMLCGLLKPTSGQAFVNGLDLQKAPSEARSHIGYMAQKFSLYGDLSVLQNLTFFAGAYDLEGEAKREAIQEMVEIFHFQAHLKTPSSELPLGFKQRLALACAMMHHPEILFLDEPTSGVDPITRREFWNHINGLVEKGVTIMVTTHFMDEAEYCDRIALIYKSKLITIDSPDALQEKAGASTLEDAFIHWIEQYD